VGCSFWDIDHVPITGVTKGKPINDPGAGTLQMADDLAGRAAHWDRCRDRHCHLWSLDVL
jgi:hypothetical protein